MIQIQTTVESKEDGQKISKTLVEARLAACVQVIGPIHSKYRWQGKVEETDEWLVLIKTRTELYESVEKAVIEIHPYENPEIIAVPIERSSAGYMAWLNDETLNDLE